MEANRAHGRNHRVVWHRPRADDLRSVFVYTNSFVVNKPQVLIARAQERFDEHGRLIDTASRGFIRDLLVSLADLTQRLKSHHSVTANA